jgi:hypothetical protein
MICYAVPDCSCLFICITGAEVLKTLICSIYLAPHEVWTQKLGGEFGKCRIIRWREIEEASEAQ